MGKILDTINSPQDLKSIDLQTMKNLANEMRQLVIQTVSRNGGHLAPSLGVVELTLALHYVFNTPKDKLVWDVGHQAYVHKIITGRKNRFHTLRQHKGISGFPRIDESEYDSFGVGHASTAISAALGLAASRDINQEKYKVIAIVGDGALTGGIAFEGLNNAGVSKKDLIVILNDNRMSISPNVGALSKCFTQVITGPLYNKIKKDIWELTGKLPKGSSFVREIVHRIEEALKSMVVPGYIFEELGFRYFGPINGHDLSGLIKVFHEIRKLNGPILVHCITKKGKGYKFAEEDATKFHGLGSFCPETGNSTKRKIPTYTEIFGKTLVQLAEKDSQIVGITAAMADGTGLIHLAKRFPERFFDVGIAEQHAVTFAAALALNGLKPVVAIYSTFLQRAFDQVIHDVALQKIPVVFALDRGGLVGEDGPTHHGSFDLSYLRLIPNFVLMAPKDENELRDMMWTALQYKNGPIAFRYPRGIGLGVPLRTSFQNIPIGKSKIEREGKDVAILAVGDMVMLSMQIAKDLENRGITTRVINGRFIKPIDRGMIQDVVEHFPIIVTLENNSVIGGFGSGVSEVMSELTKHPVMFHRFGLPDRFIAHGDRSSLLNEIGLNVDVLVRQIESLVGEVYKKQKKTRRNSIIKFKRSI